MHDIVNLNAHTIDSNNIFPGIFSGMRPCGIIMIVSELFISESLSQVYGILHNFFQRNDEAVSTLGIDNSIDHIDYI